LYGKNIKGGEADGTKNLIIWQRLYDENGKGGCWKG
jgi:hypothetical protein